MAAEQTVPCSNCSGMPNSNTQICTHMDFNIFGARQNLSPPVSKKLTQCAGTLQVPQIQNQNIETIPLI